jgi:hypothetical protein
VIAVATSLLITLLLLHLYLWVALFRVRPLWQVLLAGAIPALVPLWAWDAPRRYMHAVTVAWILGVLLFAVFLVAH